MNISNINAGYAQALYQQQNAQNEQNQNPNSDNQNAIGNENETNQTAITSTENSQNSGNSTNKDDNKQNPQNLNEQEKRQVQELQATDANVRAHEAAHKAAGGNLAGSASYTYERGPDNKMYAVAGEVSIAIGGGNSPEEKLSRAQQVRRAALAPSDPSPQDLKVAAQAISMEMDARAELAQKSQEENAKKSENDSNDNQNTSTQNEYYKAPNDEISNNESTKSSNPYDKSATKQDKEQDNNIGMF